MKTREEIFGRIYAEILESDARMINCMDEEECINLAEKVTDGVMDLLTTSKDYKEGRDINVPFAMEPLTRYDKRDSDKVRLVWYSLVVISWMIALSMLVFKRPSVEHEEFIEKIEKEKFIFNEVEDHNKKDLTNGQRGFYEYLKTEK